MSTEFPKIINDESEHPDLKKERSISTANDIIMKKLRLQMAEDNNDRKKFVDSLIEDVSPVLDLSIVSDVIKDKNLFIKGLHDCVDVEDDEEFLKNIRKKIDPLIFIKEGKPLEFGIEQEKANAEKWGGESINEVLYYGLDKEKKELQIHVHTTRETSASGETVDVIGQNISQKEKSKWLYDKLTEGLIKLREVAEKNKNEITAITGGSVLVHQLRNTLEKKLGFKVELYERKRKFDKGNHKAGDVIKDGECKMDINEFLSEEFLARILKFRKERGLD